MIVKELCNKQIIELTSGLKHYIARTIDNKVYIWGNNYWGQRGNGKKDEDLNSPEFNSFLSDLNVKVIKCGSNHSLAATQTGEIYAWGWNYYGQIGCSDDKLIPTRVEGLNDEKITMISCGTFHSIALTEKGRVFSWGGNSFGQLGIKDIEFSNKPQEIQLNDLTIEKISCGRLHTLLLSKEGVIYTFVKKSCAGIINQSNQTQNTLMKFEYEKRFIDIASHWNENISMGLSMDNIFYFWNKCTENPTETKFSSFNSLFAYYFEYNLDTSEDLIEFSDLFFRDGYYERHCDEKSMLGKGSYGEVFKVDHDTKESAIKKIRFDQNYGADILRELDKFFIVHRLKRKFVVHHYFSWLENSKIDNKIILYILMELCDKTLSELMNENKSNPNMKTNDTLTLVGYFMTSRIFIELLEGVQYLHENKIIHRDLNPDNIMLKIEMNRNRIVKICDFNLLAIHKFAQQLHTQDRGHIKYAAPEILNGRNYDTRADIYSIGVVFRELYEIDMNRYSIINIQFYII
jgi:tRNA A-37 threonylcarbamoyl transferase component Bud32